MRGHTGHRKRARAISLLVDADHEYGNALNVMRTVAGLEHAGVSMLGIEDTVLPARFGRAGNMGELVSIEEMNRLTFVEKYKKARREYLR